MTGWLIYNIFFQISDFDSRFNNSPLDTNPYSNFKDIKYKPMFELPGYNPIFKNPEYKPYSNFLDTNSCSNFRDITPYSNFLYINLCLNILDINPYSNFLHINPYSNFLDIYQPKHLISFITSTKSKIYKQYLICSLFSARLFSLSLILSRISGVLNLVLSSSS